VNRYCRFLPVLFCASLAFAQSSAEVNLGFGTVHDKAATTGVDTSGNTCTASTSSSCQLPPALSSFFLGFGGNIMLSKHFGFGGAVNLQPIKSDYSTLYYQGYGYPLKSAQYFYDANLIYAPINEKKAALRFEGGIGGASTRFSITSSTCAGSAVCSNSTQHFANANHFDIHGGAGVQVYLSEHIFVRPQFDIHYVPGLTDQFGSNVVPGATVWIGYSIGDR
jgi:hypothetical protein